MILFVLLIVFYILIADIITTLFRLTGMTEERARFQVISLLTNSGFTTQESEAVVNLKIRRRLAKATMMFGYAFTVTILSTTVNVFMTMSDSELGAVLLALPMLLLVLALFYLMRKSVFLKTKFDGWIELIGNRIMFGKKANQVVLVEEYGSMVVAHIYLHTVPAFLEDTTLAQSGIMSEHNLMIMMVKSADESDARQANGNTILKPKDTIMVLGKRQTIREIFENIELTSDNAEIPVYVHNK
jgi:hypothetical protein